MSLATTAAPWTNENNTTTRRRVPYSKRTTIKQHRAYPLYKDYNVAPANDGDDYAAADAPPPKIEAPSVKDMLDKIQKYEAIETGGNLAEFKPPPRPEVNQLRPRNALGSSPVEEGMENMDTEVPIYKPAPPISKIAAANDLGLYANYKTTYIPQKNMEWGIGRQAGTSSSSSPDDSILEKINYIIHMLEDQQHERTSNITEEVLLYTFLGVFIIFICDTFARAGKYYR